MSDQGAMAKILKQVEQEKTKGLTGGSKANKAKKENIEVKEVKKGSAPKERKFASTKSVKVVDVKREEYVGEAEIDGEIVDIYADTGSGKQFYFEKLEHGSLLRVYL